MRVFEQRDIRIHRQIGRIYGKDVVYEGVK